MNNYKQIAEKHGISADQVKDLKLGMFEIWGHVAYDWFELFGGEDEAYSAYDSEAAMIAEATIDANRVLDYTDADLSWLYKSRNPIQIAKDAWNCSW